MKKALIVDNEIDLRLILSSWAKERGYDVETAENGLEALAILQKTQDFSIMVTDFNMPLMNGKELKLKK